MDDREAIPLQINCGYARTAIRELTSTSRAKHRGVVHKLQRATEFRQLFDLPTYELPSNLFDSCATKWSPFDKHCDTIVKLFLKKWHPTAKRVEYTNTFSIEKWKALPESEKSKHTLSKCKACCHEDIQKAFPGKPVYTPPIPPPIINQENIPLNTISNEKELGRKVLQEINSVWQDKFDHPITKVIPKIMPEANLTEKETKSKRRAQSRKQKRQIVQEVNQQLAKNATMSVLAEAESLSSYSRKRLSYSFDSPVPAKRRKSHSPNEQNLCWDVTSAMEALQNFPTNEKINWSSMARKFNIHQTNGGQVLKEMAQKHGIDTKTLEQKASDTTPRLRRSKSKLRGGEISMPCLPTKEAIVEEKKQLIVSGELSIGEPCSPYTLKKTIVKNDGSIEMKTVNICGRKIPLLELRQTLLTKHKEYMRLATLDDIKVMTREEILTFMKFSHQKVNPNLTLQQLQTKLKDIQHTRTLAIWHDHSTILNTGYILFAVWVIYDKAVFLTEEEYREKTGKRIPSVQALTEVPEIYMIAPSSSSPVDQLALISDRVECLQDLSISLTACNGEQIHDKLRFFCGDKPAQQFERGTQIGGIYKCGGCGCKDSMMQDLSHALHRQWRSLTTLQTLVTSGKYGNSPGQLKPLDSLKVSELREELHARGVPDTWNKLKPELQEVLATTLQGAQRVPTLLTVNPSQSLSALNLEHYEILDCEPLHDIKGHLYNLLPEIPNLLSEPLKSEYIQVLETTMPKQKISGAVLRRAAITLLLKLQNSSAGRAVVMLLDTIIRISQLLYMPDLKRCPKMVLRLYNCTWFHHELCKQLFPTLKNQTLTHFFGIYLHAIVVHAPLQFHIMPLSSVNAESQERLFSQAKRISLRATNRKPDNVLPTILVGIQARQKMGDSKSSTMKQESIVRSVSSKLPTYSGTVIEKSFINKRLTSWQAQLERISTFLECGQGIWWEENEHSYRFHDSDTNADCHPEGPSLMHFRESSLSHVETLAKVTWKTIVQNKTRLPTPSIKLYDDVGNYKGIRNFNSTGDEQEQMDITTTTPDHTATFPEITEEEYETLQQTHTESTPSSSGLLTDTCTPHHPNHHLQPISLFSGDLLCTQNSESSNAAKTTEEQAEGTDERILNMTVVHSCTMDPTSDPIQHETNECVLQTKAAKLIQKVTGHTTILSELDFLRAKLKAKKSQNKHPSETQKEEYIQLLEKVHQTVISAKHTAKQVIKKFEQDFYKSHGTFPDRERQDYKQLRKQLDYAKYVCSIWSTFSI